MTVQAGTEISLELLVGEMEELGCEHPHHGTSSEKHGGKATHYYQRDCQFCGNTSDVLSVCWPFTTVILTDGLLQCVYCLEVGVGSQVGKILGPARS